MRLLPRQWWHGGQALRSVQRTRVDILMHRLAQFILVALFALFTVGIILLASGILKP